MGKNDVTWGQAHSTVMPPNQKVNKAEELTYLSKNTVFFHSKNTEIVINLSVSKTIIKLKLTGQNLS